MHKKATKTDYKYEICEINVVGTNGIIIKSTDANVVGFDFYNEARNAYCIVASSEPAVYANIMLQKGVI